MKKQILALISLAMLSFQGYADERAMGVAEKAAGQLNAALQKGRVDDIVSLYADNAMVIQPDGSVAKQRGDIRAFWQNLLDKKSGVMALDVVEARDDQDGTIVTTAHISDSKAMSTSPGVMKYSYDGVVYSVLKRQTDGSWKAQVQQWRDAHVPVG
jgi:uncharacterized protein (TIGR02246 family)